MSLEIEGLPRGDAPMGSHRNHGGGKEDRLRGIAAITENIGKEIRITVAHGRQLRLAGLQVDLELEQSHASRVADRGIIGAAFVLRIDKPAAAILGRAIPRIDKAAGLSVPSADPFWEIILLGYPKHSIRIHTHAQRVSHALLVIVAYLRATRLADDANLFARGSVENFHLVTGAPVGHINFSVPLDDLFGHLKVGGSHNRISSRNAERLPVILNRISVDGAVRGNKQFAIRLKSDAAKVFHFDRSER